MDWIFLWEQDGERPYKSQYRDAHMDVVRGLDMAEYPHLAIQFQSEHLYVRTNNGKLQIYIHKDLIGDD